MNDCIFCKIVNGEIPSHKVWEDADVLAFLSNFPMVNGHVIVIPKEHSVNIFDINKKDLEKTIFAVKKVASLLKKNFGVGGINLVNNSDSVSGQEVFHTHFHILPRFKDDGRDLKLIGEKKIKLELKDVLAKIKGESQ